MGRRTVSVMTLTDVFNSITLQGLATVVALALSVFTFARQEWGKRAAELIVTCERVQEEKRPRTSVAVHNSGRALARKVDVRFLNESGEPIDREMRVFGTPVDIPPGHGARLEYVRSFGVSSDSMRISWRDRRRGTQTLTVPINERFLPGTPIVNVQVVAPDPPSGNVRRGTGR
ncbi:MAG: hypothetical protein JWN68_2246 [Nocardioides sp.]|nr:hypothetical protein [Nocardioides sp.]